MLVVGNSVAIPWTYSDSSKLFQRKDLRLHFWTSKNCVEMCRASLYFCVTPTGGLRTLGTLFWSSWKSLHIVIDAAPTTRPTITVTNSHQCHSLESSNSDFVLASMNRIDNAISVVPWAYNYITRWRLISRCLVADWLCFLWTEPVGKVRNRKKRHVFCLGSISKCESKGFLNLF